MVEETKPADTGTKLDMTALYAAQDAERNDDGHRQTCLRCQGTGKVLTLNDWIQDSLKLFPSDDPAAMDGIVQEFYRRLLAADETKQPGDKLAPLFPSDLVNAQHSELDSKGKQQRDKLLDALLLAIGDYDPDHPDSDQMRHLKTVLAQAGRSHSAFLRPDGSIRGAEEEEYLAVEQVLLGMLRETFGPKWRPEYDWAWHRAYRHAMRRMLAAAEDAAPFSRSARMSRPAR